jgi:phage terminase small subunit
MAGVKGRSGGPRPNSGGPRANSGGARPGAGRKPAPKLPADVVSEMLEAKEFLTKVMLGHIEPSDAQLKAATVLYGKKAEAGVKDVQAEAAKKASKGRFAAAPAPLRMVK